MSWSDTLTLVAIILAALQLPLGITLFVIALGG